MKKREEVELRSLLVQIDGSNTLLLTAELEDQIVGTLRVFDMDKPFRMVTDLFVKRGHRRRGIATKLFQEVFAVSGGLPVTLHVKKKNKKAIALYEGFGFVKYNHDETNWFLIRTGVKK